MTFQIAQSCNRCTAVGLARTPEVDLRFFLPPPPLPERVARAPTPKLFERILSALPSSGSPYVHDCIRSLTSTALDSYVPGMQFNRHLGLRMGFWAWVRNNFFRQLQY